MNAEKSQFRGYDDVVLSALVSEFPFSDKKEVEEMIRERLVAYALGGYDQQRVDLLRSLKDAAQTEIKRFSGSKYYIGGHGGALEDFDRSRMVEDYSRVVPDIPKHTIESFVDCAIYYYYLR